MNNRDKVTPVRFNADERRTLERAARRAGLRLSAYIRREAVAAARVELGQKAGPAAS
jgi:molecular chaperone DnaK (HSP70)